MKTLLTLLCLVLFAGCGLPDIRIKRRITPEEVVGTWLLDPKSSALQTDGDHEDCLIDSSLPHEVVFRPDGTCRYRSLLQMPTRYVDCEGTWSIVPSSDDPRGSEIKLVIESGGGLQFSLDAKEESGQLILWEFWSDPDLWSFLEYRRRESSQAAPSGADELVR